MIKWQYGDTLLHTPDMIREKFSTDKHTVIQLNVPRKQQIQRLQTKTWWHDNGHEDEFISGELLLVEESIKDLSDRFAIRQLDW